MCSSDLLLKQLGAKAYTLLDIAGTILGQTKYASVVKAVKAIVEVVQFVETINTFITSTPGPLKINFGDFVVGGDARTKNNPAAVPTNTFANMDANS